MVRYLVLGHSMVQVEDWRKVNRIPAAAVFYAVNAEAVRRAPRDVTVVTLPTFATLAPPDRVAEVTAAVAERWPGKATLTASLELLAVMYRARREGSPEQLDAIRAGWSTGGYAERARASDEGMAEAAAFVKSIMGWA